MPDSFSPPVLETPRLLLAGHEPSDFEPLSEMWAEPAVVKHIFAGEPSPRRDSWMRMLAYRGLWPLLGYGYWSVREKTSGRYVGDLGFADFHRNMTPSVRGIPEAGWALAPWAHGQGFATEGLAAALDWLDRQENIDRSVCLISPANLASIRVAGKAGYNESQGVVLNDRPSLLFTRMRLSACPPAGAGETVR